MKNILIVEDDSIMNQMLATRLKNLGFHPHSAYCIDDALHMIQENSYHLILLDVNLPDGNGFQTFSRFKKEADCAIVFLTANDLEPDIIRGYDLGADDYITKPFSIEVFQRKIVAIMNRVVSEDSNHVFDDGHIHIDFTELTAQINKKALILTPLEYRTLEVFVGSSHRILTRQHLLEILWDFNEDFVEETSLNAVICRIRKKIEKDGFQYIKTVYGIGYKWVGGTHE